MMKRTKFEFSAGGVVRQENNLLMVLVQNLEGQKIWTFPKGHLEKGETAEQAAVREVQEETGYRCTIVEPFGQIQYWFKHDRQLTKKSVAWFLMTPVEKVGVHDPAEILEARWISLNEAAALVRYHSDKKILAQLQGIRQPEGRRASDRAETPLGDVRPYRATDFSV